MSKTDKLKDKYDENEVVRTSLRMTAGRRVQLKEWAKEFGAANQDDVLAFLVDHFRDNMTEKTRKAFTEFVTKERESRMSESQKNAAKRKQLASLPQDELDRLLEQAGLNK